jgi:hypothetical protein
MQGGLAGRIATARLAATKHFLDFLMALGSTGGSCTRAATRA